MRLSQYVQLLDEEFKVRRYVRTLLEDCPDSEIPQHLAVYFIHKNDEALEKFLHRLERKINTQRRSLAGKIAMLAHLGNARRVNLFLSSLYSAHGPEALKVQICSMAEQRSFANDEVIFAARARFDEELESAE